MIDTQNSPTACVVIYTLIKYSIYYLSNWNKLFLRDIYISIVGVANYGVLDNMTLLFILSCLVSNVCIKLSIV